MNPPAPPMPSPGGPMPGPSAAQSDPIPADLAPEAIASALPQGEFKAATVMKLATVLRDTIKALTGQDAPEIPLPELEASFEGTIPPELAAMALRLLWVASQVDPKYEVKPAELKDENAIKTLIALMGALAKDKKVLMVAKGEEEKPSPTNPKAEKKVVEPEPHLESEEPEHKMPAAAKYA